MPSLNERPSLNVPLAGAALVCALALCAPRAAAQSTAAGEAPAPPPALAPEPSAPSSQEPVTAPPPPPPRRRESPEALPRPGASPAEASPRPDSLRAPLGFIHDGFYLRFGLGGGYGKTSVQTDRISQPDVSLDGFGAGFDVWLGWTLAPGFVLGPAITVSSQRSSSASIGGGESSGVATHALLGAFVDAFPNPRGGQHFGGVLALASLTETTAAKGNVPETNYQGTGLGLAVFAGYDAWIAREWSLGALLRVGGVATRATQTFEQQSVEKQGTAYGACLLVTIVYH